MPTDEPFASTPESIRRRAKRFEIAMWSFLAEMSLGLAYALWKGSSFFPALRQAQLQFGNLEQANKISEFVPFVNGVIANWQERLAAYPATWVELLVIILAFVLWMGAFRVVRKSPKGEPVLKSHPAGRLRKERVQRAFDLARTEALLYMRTDESEAAGCKESENAVYLPLKFVQKLDRKLLDNVPEQLAFIVLHEKMHGSSSDNLLWSWGRSLAFLLTAVSAILIASPIMMGAVAAFPTILAKKLPQPLNLTLEILFIIILLAFIGIVVNGVLPNLAATREFFADALATRTPGIGPPSLPYEKTEDISSLGDMATGWSMTIAGPDRRLHAKGIAPRTGALAASTVAMWILVRTLVLMLDPSASNGVGVVWAFDAACLIGIWAMLSSLPRRRTSARDYGLLPWITTLILASLIALSFALIDQVYGAYGVTSIIRPLWLVVVAVPPFAASAALLLWRSATAVVQKDLEDIDRLPPRRIGIGFVAKIIGAVPSYVWSYAMAGVALYTCCTTLSAWLSWIFFHVERYFLFEAVSLAVCAAFAVIVVRNFRVPSLWSALFEAILGLAAFILFIYGAIVVCLVVAQNPPASSGPTLDFALFVKIFLSFPGSAVGITFIVAVIFGSVLLGSWEMRYRLSLGKSLFADFLNWLGAIRRSLCPKKNEPLASNAG